MYPEGFIVVIKKLEVFLRERGFVKNGIIILIDVLAYIMLFWLKLEKNLKIQIKLSRSKNIIYNIKLPPKRSKFDVFIGIKSFYRKIVKNEKHSRKGIKKIYKNM